MDQIAHGADWIKVYADRKYFRRPDGSIRSLPNFTADELAAIVDQAHRTGLRVAAHSMTPTGHALALGAGVDTIEHGPVLDDATIATMVKQGTYWCPTAMTLAHVAPERGKTNPIWLALRDAEEDSFRRALKAGVKIALGTDAGAFRWDESNQAEELAWYVAHGMTTWQALRAATVVPAELLDRKGELGTLAPGARADLVALAADPIADVAALQHANASLRLGGWNLVFSTPDLHRWHHAADPRHARSNYGSTLIVWDLLLGTRALPEGAPGRYGIEGESVAPQGIRAQLGEPWG
mgnify:CR=1 FL=1